MLSSIALAIRSSAVIILSVCIPPSCISLSWFFNIQIVNPLVPAKMNVKTAIQTVAAAVSRAALSVGGFLLFLGFALLKLAFYIADEPSPPRIVRLCYLIVGGLAFVFAKV